MKINVKHIAKLRQYADQDSIEIEMEPGSTVNDLLLKLEIEKNDIGISIINGKVATLDQELKNNVLVTLMPYIGGG